MFGLRLHWWIVIGLAVGAVAGVSLRIAMYEEIQTAAWVDVLARQAMAEQALDRDVVVQEVLAERARTLATDASVTPEFATLRAINAVTGTQVEPRSLSDAQRQIRAREAMIFSRTGAGIPISVVIHLFLLATVFAIVPLLLLAGACRVFRQGNRHRARRRGFVATIYRLASLSLWLIPLGVAALAARFMAVG